MILTFLFAGLLSWSKVIYTSDSLETQVVNLRMDTLEVVPLPIFPGFINGNSPVEIEFERSTIDISTQLLYLKGQVIDQQDKFEIPGVRIVIGSLDSTLNGVPKFTPRTSVLTDYRGEFTLNLKIKKSDVLIVVWLGYLEKVYSFRKII